MSGIIGIAAVDQRVQAEQMLSKLAHRGPAGQQIVEIDGHTLGLTWTRQQESDVEALSRGEARDATGAEHFAIAQVTDGRLTLKRDPLGVAPLYYGASPKGDLCFASEVKALLPVTRKVHEFPPGHQLVDGQLQAYFRLQAQPPIDEPPSTLSEGLRRRLAAAVEKHIDGELMGAWLSGGLDSSALAALARPHLKRLHTFAVGIEGAPDLEYARQVADFIGSDHHQLTVMPERLQNILPVVIYHLESFDAPLVRSSLTNYLVAQLASNTVSSVFSGEGGDELFAGYAYLKTIDPARLPDELIDITARLHNTALQRVDRSASAHGTLAHVSFLDPEVVIYALRIPAHLKLRAGVEKWILRQALDGILPQPVLDRPKAKFWEGAGVGTLLAEIAERQISNVEFERERQLPNGELICTKEELMYYRVFKECFGALENLDWMGRTKGFSANSISPNVLNDAANEGRAA